MIHNTPNPTASAPLTPYTHQSITAYQSAPLEPVEGRRVIGYERYGGDLLVPVYEAPPAPVPAQPMVVHRGIDPLAQRAVAGGIGAGAAGAGIGWGAGQALAGIAAFGGVTSLAVLTALLLLARFSGGRTTINQTTTVHNTNRWLGRSNTTTRQG